MSGRVRESLSPCAECAQDYNDLMRNSSSKIEMASCTRDKRWVLREGREKEEMRSIYCGRNEGSQRDSR